MGSMQKLNAIFFNSFFKTDKKENDVKIKKMAFEKMVFRFK